MNSTAIIIPSWNSKDRIGECIESLIHQTRPVDIIVVENGSTDGSADYIRTTFPQVSLLIQPKNLGFAGGVNMGIRHALERTYEYIGLFNDDAVADKDWVRYLIDILEDNPAVGVATGLLLHGDGKTIDSSGDWYSVWGLPFPRSRNEHTETAPGAGLVFSGSGGASIYRSSLLKTAGFFDETFFAYYEDVDISFRAQLSGSKVYYEPRAIAYHERGASSSTMESEDTVTAATRADKISGFTVYQTFKNLPLLFIKDVPRGLLLKIGIRFFLGYFLMIGNAVKNGKGGSAIRGLGKSVLLTSHALHERRRIQHSKAVTTDYIASILWPDLPPDQTGLRKFRKIFTGKS